MAIIQNSKIIQKLIDELELYPALDKVPTELADKILAVYQVNEADVNVKIEENLKLYSDLVLNDSDKTFTVPDDKKWKIKHLSFKIITDANAANRGHRIIIKNGDGHVIWATQSSVLIPASKTKYCVCADNVNAFSVGSVVCGGDEDYHAWYLPAGIVLTEGGTIQIVCFSGSQVGDDMETYLTVDEQDA